MRRTLSHLSNIVRGGLLFLGCLLLFQVGLDQWQTFQQQRAITKYENAVIAYAEFVEAHGAPDPADTLPCLNWDDPTDRVTAERMMDLLLDVYVSSNVVRDYELAQRNSDPKVLKILSESTDVTRKSLDFLRHGLAGRALSVPAPVCRDRGGGEITL